MRTLSETSNEELVSSHGECRKVKLILHVRRLLLLKMSSSTIFLVHGLLWRTRVRQMQLHLEPCKRVDTRWKHRSVEKCDHWCHIYSSLRYVPNAHSALKTNQDLFDMQCYPSAVDGPGGDDTHEYVEAGVSCSLQIFLFSLGSDLLTVKRGQLFAVLHGGTPKVFAF